MAKHSSAVKRNRQRLIRTDRNRSVRATVRTYIKRARAAIATTETSPEDRTAAVTRASSALDKAARKGVVHPKKAARTKARLARAAHLAQASKAAES